jgi:hypothetical protein
MNMSKHDSNKSADKKSAVNLDDLFVPVIVTVVVCIVVLSAFDDKETGSQLAGVADKEQAAPATDTTAVTAIHPKAPEVADASLKTMHTTAIADQSIPRDLAAAAQAADGAGTADADVISPAQNSLTAGIDGTVANPAIHTASTGKPAADQNAPDRDDPANNGSGKQVPVADGRQMTNPIQDQRRSLYQDARQAQQAHRMKMLDYRARVMKRIEQDRRDLYRYRQNSTQQRLEHRDRYRDRLEQARNGTKDMPI